MQCSIKKQSDMRKRDTIKMEVTPEEEELIKAIRNYCASYPNGIRNCWTTLRTFSKG